MKPLPWLLLLAAVLALAWTGSEIVGARAEAERERGRVVELERQTEAADARYDAVLDVATARGDTVEILRREGAQIRQQEERRAALARRDAIEAGQAETGYLARVRATMEAAGLPTADVDSASAASARERQGYEVQLAAKDTIIEGQDREIRATRSYAETMALALDAADARTVAVMAERDSYRRQAEAWARVAQPGWLDRLRTEAGRALVYGGIGWVAGRL